MMPSRADILRRMGVQQVMEFARINLEQPDTVLKLLEDAEIDGEALLLCNERNMDKVLPGLPIGHCLKLLNRIKDYLALSSSDTEEPTVLSDNNDDLENQPPDAPSPTPVTPGSPSIPFSGEFPIESVVFGPASQQAFRTGIVKRDAKSDILQALHNKVLQLSVDKTYGDRQIRLSAAEELIRRFPLLKEGRSTQDAVNSWRSSLTMKGKNVRRFLMPENCTRLAEEREKNRTSRSCLRDNQVPHPKTRKRTASQMLSLPEVELNDQTVKQQSLQVEMMKAKRERNFRLLTSLHDETYELRRKNITEESLHMTQIFREWPTLRYNNMIIRDVTRIVGISKTVFKRLPTDKLLDFAADFMRKQPRSHPIGRVLYPPGRGDKDDEVISDSIALGTLPYVLPTRAKKTLFETHRFVIDMYPNDTPMAEVNSDVPGRNCPWILLRGSWSGVENIHVISDGTVTVTAESISEAVHLLIGVHYVQDVEYHPQIKLALKYLEQHVCGMPSVGREDYRDITSFVNMLTK